MKRKIAILLVIVLVSSVYLKIKNKKVINQNINYEILNYSYLDIESENYHYVDMKYGSNSKVDTLIKTKNNYGQLIRKYSDIYGLDYHIMLAIATQESGNEGHLSYIDKSGAVGIMQIQYNAWINEELTAYNYSLNQYETIVVDDSIKDVEQNIKVGCMIFQMELRKYNYNLIAGIQSYNYGGIRVKKIISYYAALNNLTYEEVLNDYTNTSWLQYRSSIVSQGDSNYVENVLRWYDGIGLIKYKNMDKFIKISLNKTMLFC